MTEIDYKQRRRNRRKRYYRVRLGVLQMIHKPLLNLLLIPIVIGTVFIWIKQDEIISLLDVPEFLLPIYRYIVLIFSILLPILCLLSLIDTIGQVTAKSDEADLQEAFKKQEQRNGVPILIDKKRIKGSNVTMREFYSEIPMKIWLERQEDISDLMNVHFVENIQYGGKSNGRRIVMYTAQGRENTPRGNLYEEEF